MKLIPTLALVAMLSGCLATGRGCTEPAKGSIPVPVPVPIKCQATMPSRPAMVTESLSPEPAATFLDRLVAALTAEIEVHEGYEGLLVTELQSCL